MSPPMSEPMGPAEPMQLAAAAPEALTREQRFEAALSCREEGKGVKPRQGCSSVQLNRECKEGTRTPEYVKFLETVRQTADAEVLGKFGTNSGSFDRADFMKIERPLQCARIVFTTVCSVSLARLTISFFLFSCSCWAGHGEVLQRGALAEDDTEEAGQREL